MTGNQAIYTGPSGGWRCGSVDVTGGRLTYHRTGGPGSTILLSHGLTDNGLSWGRFARAMQEPFERVREALQETLKSGALR